MKEISLQLYSIHHSTAKDFVGSLETVAKMGYTGVEFAGFGNICAEEMKAHLERLNLKPIGSHESLARLENELENVLEYNKIIGSKHISCPYAPLHNEAAVLAHAEKFNEIGRKVTEAGFIFSYHNHAFEFEKEGDTYFIDLLYQNTDPKYVKAEFDVFWVASGGEDPIEYLTKYQGRCPIVHLKQLHDFETKKNCCAGDGVLDFKKIIDVASSFESTDFVYEQESEDIPELEGAERSCKYLLSL